MPPCQPCPDFRRAALDRRTLLHAGSLSLVGLGLPELLQARAGPTVAGAKLGRAKACILLFMWGGPAHQDTWDPKPEAPVEYRGEFKPIATRVPGLFITEYLPQLAQRTHQLAVLRSMTHGDVDHTTATHWLLCGRGVPRRGAPASEDWPSYGAILSKLGYGWGPLPPFVSMMPVVPNGAPRFVEESHGRGAGWLGPRFDPLRIDADASRPDYKVGNFALNAGLSKDRLAAFRQFRARLTSSSDPACLGPQTAALEAHYDRAWRLLAAPSVAAAFDLTKEHPRVRERYGLNIHGQSVLQARRLVEAGVPLVTVFWPNDGITNVSVYWDTHSRNFRDLKSRLCPVTDQAFSALLDDLAARGMLEETLVIWTGEMGRTPRVGQSVVGGAGASRDGRDHWPHVFTTVLAGGGIKGGVVHGASDRLAAYPAQQPTSPADLAATVYHCLGIDPHLQLHGPLGQPLTLCEGSPIEAILAG